MEQEINYLLLVSGVLVMLITIADIMITTFVPLGSPFISDWVRSVIWRTFLIITGKNGRNKLLNYCGMFTVMGYILGWTIAVWLGNALIFLSDPASIVQSGTYITATSWQKVYFVGYTLSTMGLGDFAPASDGWSLFASFISFSGFILITIMITYLIPVVSSAINGRKLSISISAMGYSPENIVYNCYNGENFCRLNDQLSNLIEPIDTMTQQHLAYPILHNFHSHRPTESLPITIALLDEALSLILLYVPVDKCPDPEVIYPLRSAISRYLSTLNGAFIYPAKSPPPRLKGSDPFFKELPVRQPNNQSQMEEKELEYRRRLLKGMLDNDGWYWDDMWLKATYSEFDLERVKPNFPDNKNKSSSYV